MGKLTILPETKGRRHVGILSVSYPMRVKAKRALPPEHSLKAVLDSPVKGMEDWLIEGPLMPLCDERKPMPVVINFEIRINEKTGRATLFGLVGRDQHRYEVGEWPDMNAFKEYWSGLS